jgi:hypothetical protein
MATREQRLADVIIENPILNCPFREPARHFRFADEGITDEILFLVEFQNDDAGPWGCKLDKVENDLSGALHRKAHVAFRRGIEQSSPPPRRELILGSAQRIYEAGSRRAS